MYRPYLKFFFNFHFWIILLIFFICITLHYPIYIPFIKKFNINSFFGLNRHAIDRILFLLPITYSAFIFGIKGGLFTLILSLIFMLPRIFFISEWPIDAAFETSITFFIGILINIWLHTRRIEIGKRDQIILKLENAKKLEKKLQYNLKLYTEQISKGYEEERKRIARELHDDTIQTLLSITRELDNYITSNNIQEKSLNKIEEIQKNISQSIDRIRDFIQFLRPPTLDYLGLIPAIRELVNKIKKKSSINITFETNNNTIKELTDEQELLIYRIIQEGLRNISKHSLAKKAKVIFKIINNNIIITIKDNGIGFLINKNSSLLHSGKLGIMGMKERIELLNGSINIKSIIKKGTLIKLTIPIIKSG